MTKWAMKVLKTNKQWQTKESIIIELTPTAVAHAGEIINKANITLRTGTMRAMGTLDKHQVNTDSITAITNRVIR